MKYLLLATLFTPCIGYCQQEVPKGTNIILVKTGNIKQIVLLLEQKGYSVANDGFGVLTTIPKRLSNHGTIMITVKIKDSVSYISGIFEERIITPELFKNKDSYGGHDLSGSFNILNDIALALHAEIGYLKE